MSQLLKVTFEYMRQPVADYHYMLRENKMLYANAGSVLANFAYKLNGLISSGPRQLGSLSNVTRPDIAEGLRVVQKENELIRGMIKRLATVLDGLGGRLKQSHDELKAQGNEWKTWEGSFAESMGTIQTHYDQGSTETSRAKLAYEDAKRRVEQAQEHVRLTSAEPELRQEAALLERTNLTELQTVKGVYNTMIRKHRATNELISGEVEGLARRIGKCFIDSTVLTTRVLQSTVNTLNSMFSNLLASYPSGMLSGVVKELKEFATSKSPSAGTQQAFFECPELPEFCAGLLAPAETVGSSKRANSQGRYLPLTQGPDHQHEAGEEVEERKRESSHHSHSPIPLPPQANSGRALVPRRMGRPPVPVPLAVVPRRGGQAGSRRPHSRHSGYEADECD